MTISRPTFTLFLCPPEIPRFSTVPTSESLIACRPRASITLSTTRTLSALEMSAESLQHHGKRIDLLSLSTTMSITILFSERNMNKDTYINLLPFANTKKQMVERDCGYHLKKKEENLGVLIA